MSLMFDRDGEPITKCQTCARPYVNPDHDSLFVRFEQLQNLLENADKNMIDGQVHDAYLKLQNAQVLARLLRGQVLK